MPVSRWSASAARSGAVGFNVATLSRLVREKVRPAGSGGGCEREKVRPLRSQWLKIGVIWRAGSSVPHSGVTVGGRPVWYGCGHRVILRESSLLLTRNDLEAQR